MGEGGQGIEGGVREYRGGIGPIEGHRGSRGPGPGPGGGAGVREGGLPGE
jgi:hypothetical protein